MRSISTFFEDCSGRGSDAAAALASTLDALGLSRTAVAVDYVDALLVEVCVEFLHLLLADLGLLEPCLDLVDGQEAALLALGDQRSYSSSSAIGASSLKRTVDFSLTRP